MDVDFYTLERHVQDRFADATRGIGLPTPLLREASKDYSDVFWLVGAAVSLIALGFSALVGFGNLDSSMAIARPSVAVVSAVVVAAAAYCVLRFFAIRDGRARIPYLPGLYLFPAGVFDARAEPIRVFLHPDIKETKVVGDAVCFVTGGGSFLFNAGDAGMAARVEEAFARAAEQCAQVLQTANRREQAMLDPLVDSGFSSPFSPQMRIARRVPLWAKVAPVIALAFGAALGPLLWKVRNVVSEERIYAAAVHRNDVASYREYLARGGPRADVAEVRLPRAELAEAVHAGTVEAIEQFAATHPDSKIAGEIDAALHAAVGVELDAAIHAGTVTALRAFRVKRSKYAFTAPAVEAATVAIYRRLLARFAAGKDPAVVSFFERLLGYAKAHGPGVHVLFVRRITDSVGAADNQVKMSAYYMGKQSLPSQYFVGDYAARREAAAADRLAHVIGDPFPADVLAVTTLPAFTDPGAPPAPTEPTLSVEYAPELAGGYMSPKPRGVFVGVGMTFKASFQIPGDDQPLEVKSSLWRAPTPQVLRDPGTSVSDVYDKMAGDGFAKFVKDFSALLGVPGS